ncbi:MAG: response regulator [Sphingomonadaceae bacterium]|jgi:DNA-binding NtrC family response regulator|nr:MAG: response regulator [Sphingomonadaceae bacterium]
MMRHLLIIEDDDDLRTELIELIEALGARAIGARSGEEALTALDTASCSVDVILCDLRLKAESGLDVLRMLRHRRSTSMTEPTMYLMTGHLDLTAAALSDIATTTSGLFTKPLRTATLRALVASQIGSTGNA